MHQLCVLLSKAYTLILYYVCWVLLYKLQYEDNPATLCLKATNGKMGLLKMIIICLPLCVNEKESKMILQLLCTIFQISNYCGALATGACHSSVAYKRCLSCDVSPCNVKTWVGQLF